MALFTRTRNSFRWQRAAKQPKNMGVLVVFCSFMVLSLGPGMLNAFGVYEEEYDRLFDSKDEDDEKWPLGSPVIFIGVLQILLSQGMGFIGGRAAQRFGPGPTVFIGGVLMSLGLFSASYAKQVWQLCLTQGVVFGTGVMLTWIPAASAPSSWFAKNKGLATGITHMGLGIGGLVFSPLTRFLLEKTGTSGSLRWLSLISLIGVTLASLGVHSKKHERASDLVISSIRWSKRLETEFENLPEDGFDSDQEVDYPQYCRESRMLLRGDTMRDSEEGCGGDILATEEEISEILEAKFAAVTPHAGNRYSSGDKDDKVADSSEDMRSGKGDIMSESSEDEGEFPLKGKMAYFAEEELAEPKPVKHVHFSPSTLKMLTLERLEGMHGSNSDQNVSELLSARKRANERARVRRSRKRVTRAVSKRISMLLMSKSSAKDPEVSSSGGSQRSARSVLRSWRFWFLSLGVGIGQAGWYIVLLFMTSIGVSIGLDVHSAAIILGAINGASAMGQFMAGYAADVVGPVNSLLLFTLIATVSNAILFVPKLTFHSLLAYACLCGVSIGAADPLAVMAGVTQFGRSRAASTTGMMYGSVGFLVLITAPSARVVLSTIGGGQNYLPVYVMIVAMFALSTLLLLVLRLRISCQLAVRA